MTVQTTPPAATDDLVREARGLAREAGRLPSPSKLQRALRIGYPRAQEIHARALREIAEKKAASRRVMRAVRARSTGRRTLPARFVPVPPVPTSPGMGPVAQIAFPQATTVAKQPYRVEVTPASPEPRKGPRKVQAWPLILLALPAFVAIWAGWVDLGRLTGFGVVHPLPGILDDVAINTAITLPIGLETYGTYALYVWLSGAGAAPAKRFAMWSAIGSLAVGALGQVAYHLMAAADMTAAPWLITTVVACLPVAVLGMGAALYHLVHAEES